MTVELSLGVAGGANSIDEVIARYTSAGTDDRVPYFVVLARNVADSVNRIIDLSGRTNTTTVDNEVVAFSTDTLSIDKYFIGVAVRDAETKIFHESFVANARFGDLVVGSVKDTSLTGTISHLPKVG